MSGEATRSRSLLPLPAQPADVPWPTREWPRAELDARVDRAALEKLLDHAFAGPEPEDLERTHSVVDRAARRDRRGAPRRGRRTGRRVPVVVDREEHHERADRHPRPPGAARHLEAHSREGVGLRGSARANHDRPDAADGRRASLPRSRAPRRRRGPLLPGSGVGRDPDALRRRQERRRGVRRRPAARRRARSALELQQRREQPARAAGERHARLPIATRRSRSCAASSSIRSA